MRMELGVASNTRTTGASPQEPAVSTAELLDTSDSPDKLRKPAEGRVRTTALPMGIEAPWKQLHTNRNTQSVRDRSTQRDAYRSALTSSRHSYL
jgi:hypothetical protein